MKLQRKWRLQNSPVTERVVTMPRSGYTAAAARAQRKAAQQPIAPRLGGKQELALGETQGTKHAACEQPALPAPLVRLDGWILLYQHVSSALSARKPCSRVCLPLDVSQRGGSSGSRQPTFYQPADVARTVAGCRIQACPAPATRCQGKHPRPLPPGIKTLGGCKIDTP